MYRGKAVNCSFIEVSPEADSKAEVSEELREDIFYLPAFMALLPVCGEIRVFLFIYVLIY